MKYNYYIHRTVSEDIDSFFNYGLIDYDPSFKIESTMELLTDEVAENKEELANKMKSSIIGDDTYNTVFLIKIPKDYFPYKYKGFKSLHIPMPIFKEKEDCNQKSLIHDTYPVLIPNLIQGCYNKKRGFISNPNYNPVYDPSGLKFGYEQLQELHNSFLYDYNKCIQRNKTPVHELYKDDIEHDRWNEYVELFSKKLGIDEPADSSIIFTREERRNMKINRIKGRMGL